MASWFDRLPKKPLTAILPWLLEKGCPPIQYRTLTEILDRPAHDPAVQRAREGAANYKPAVTIARAQKESGVWLDKVLDFEVPNPSRKRGPGMVNQFLALVEQAWDSEHPIVHCSAMRLMTYLHEDSISDLFELKGYAGTNPAATLSIRRGLRVIAAALLARCGYVADDELRRAAARVLEELDDQYPEHGEPNLYDGTVEIEEGDSKATLRVIREGAHVPDMFLFYLLSFHPVFSATDRARRIVRRVVEHLMRGDPITRRARQANGRIWVKLCDLPIATWTQADYEAGRIGFLLHDLELLARLGLLPSVPKALELLDWVLSLQDAGDGVFRHDAGLEKHVTRSQYHYFPIEDSWRGKHKKYTDFTFRACLILRELQRRCPA
jgi:hypothetical protein